MDKYKILGSINILLGGMLAILVVIVAVGIIPQLVALSSQLGTNTSVNFTFAYGGLVVVFIAAMINLFLGRKLIWGSTSDKEKYFVPGVIWGVSSLILPGAIIVPTVLLPIYNLTSSFNGI